MPRFLIRSFSAYFELSLIFGAGAILGWTVRDAIPTGEKPPTWEVIQEVLGSKMFWATVITTLGAAGIARIKESLTFWHETSERIRDALEAFGFGRDVEAIVYTRSKGPNWRRRRGLQVLKARTPYISLTNASGRRARKPVHSGVGMVGWCYSQSTTRADIFPNDEILLEKSRTVYGMREPTDQRQDIRAMFAVPVWEANEKAIGVIFIRSPREEAFAMATPENIHPEDWVTRFDCTLDLIGRRIVG